MSSENQESAFELEEFNKQQQSFQANDFKIRSQKRSYDGFTEGPWKIQQNLIYVIFMEIYQPIFSSKSKRKFSKIFTNLAAHLKTRNASQCRSHFQKLMGRHKTLKNIFKFYKTQVGEDVYHEKYFLLEKELGMHEDKSEVSQCSKEKVRVDQAIQTDDTLFQNLIDPRLFPFFNQQWCYQNLYSCQNQFLAMNDLS